MPGIQHLQVRLDGILSTTQSWSVNPKFALPGGGGVTVPTQSVMDAWAAALVALGTDLLPAREDMSNAVHLNGVTVSYITAAGTALVMSKGVLGTPVSGTGAVVMPPQASVVTTLQTNNVGRRYRGRLYLPLLGLQVQGDSLRLTATQTQTIATETASWLHALASAWPGSGTIVPAVISSIVGEATPISSVRVGDIVDTQRRRRDQFPENFSTATV